MKRGTKITLAVTGGLFAGILGVAIAHQRPLIPSRDPIATFVEDDEGKKDARIYTMLFRPRQVFVEVPGAERTRWFCIDWETREVFIPNGPYRFPWLSYPADMFLGVELDFEAKLGEKWVVTPQSDGVRFSNGSLHVHVHE